MPILVGILYIGALVYFANCALFAEGYQPIVRWMQYILIGLIVFLGVNLFFTAQSYRMMQGLPEAFAQTAESGIPEIDILAAGVFLFFTLCVGSFAYFLMRSPFIRDMVTRGVQVAGGRPVGFDAENPIHLTALLLMLFMIVNVFSSFLLAGGLEGIASSYASESIQVGDFLFDAFVYVLLALLGVGLYIRRDLPQSLERLGIRIPNREDVTLGVLTGIGMYIGVIGMNLVWILISSPEGVDAQTVAAESLFAQFSQSLVAATLLALSTAIGEEIIFRGALQPIFGLIPVSLFFALIHVQYTFTFASIIILGVALVLGLLRLRVSTSAAMIAHFVYNLTPFILYTIAISSGGS